MTAMTWTDVTFLDVERAIAARPSVFTETEQSLLEHAFGLAGAPRPERNKEGAKRLKMSTTRYHEMKIRALQKVILVIESIAPKG